MFTYRISVIVPVYNSEQYLFRTLDSLLSQTMCKDDFEVLLIDDGSTDSSADVCKEYVEKNKIFKYFLKENSGVSSTRNFGIEHSCGKYFLYLDSDDTITENTLKTVADFFDSHFDEIDLVTYKIVPIVDDKPSHLHFRYKTLDHTGIYDLNEPENWYITQSTINVCVKNKGNGNNILFDTNYYWGEDQNYNCTILADKMKIGYCDEPEYTYYRHSDSITGSKSNAYFIFEATTSLWESLLNHYSDNVPPYIQAIVLNDYSWKGAADLLIPYHYSEDELTVAVNRMIDIISCFDDEVIMNHPNVDLYHKTYLLGLKKNSELHCTFDNNGIHLIANGNEVYSSETLTVTVTKLKIIRRKLCFDGYIKSPAMLYAEKPRLFLCQEVERKELELVDSACDYYHAKIKTAKFWRFVHEFDIDTTKSFRFEIELGGKTFEPIYFFMPTTTFRQGELHKVFFAKKHRFSFSKRTGVFKISGKTNIVSRGFTSFCHFLHYCKKSPKISFFRFLASFKPKTETWIYLDRYGIFDNAYLQFKHDIKIDDGIDRYYIINSCDTEKIEEHFSPEERKKLVTFESYRHKYLYLNCDKLITSFSNLSNISPFGAKAMHWYADITKHEIIYLQHGVLHASLLGMYAKERAQIDRIVISSSFEKDNFVSKYGYAPADLIPSGMPRYDLIKVGKKPQNRILFSPSWRSNIIGNLINNERESLPEAFLASDFYKQVNALISSKELADLLEQNDLYLDFKNHPIFKCYNDLFTVGSNRITISCGDTKIDDYKLMITDYSSIVFDAVYLNCPILYFVPDYDKFIAGVSHNYRELDLPLEQGFGALTFTADEMLTELKKCIEADFVPQTPYAERMSGFFLHKDTHCRDRLYENIIENN